jgi:hypothetical protein
VTDEAVVRKVRGSAPGAHLQARRRNNNMTPDFRPALAVVRAAHTALTADVARLGELLDNAEASIEDGVDFVVLDNLRWLAKRAPAAMLAAARLAFAAEDADTAVAMGRLRG